MGKWEMVKLGGVVEILDNRRIPITASKRISGIYPYYGANGVQDYVNDFIFDEELVLLAEDGGNFGSKTRPIAYRASGKCWVNNHAHVLRATNKIEVDFLCYSLMFYDVSAIINGATRAKLNKSSVEKMLIPLPPIETQKKIADILDKASELIEKRKAQIAKLDELTKSIFIDMFGDPVTNPKGWKVGKLEDFTLFLTSGSRGWSEYFSNAGELFLTIKNVKEGKLLLNNVQYVNAPRNQEAKRTKVKQYDLLISITADLGRTAVVDKLTALAGAYINQHLSLVRLDIDKVNPIYISRFLESQAGKIQFQSKNQEGVKSGLNFNSIKSLNLILPPLKLQKEFADIVEHTEQQKALLQQSCEKLELNYKSLMQKCFSGEMF